MKKSIFPKEYANTNMHLLYNIDSIIYYGYYGYSTFGYVYTKEYNDDGYEIKITTERVSLDQDLNIIDSYLYSVRTMTYELVPN